MASTTGSGLAVETDTQPERTVTGSADTIYRVQVAIGAGLAVVLMAL